MSNPIPTKSREMVHARDLHRCQRCGGAGTDPHHRRSRRIKDAHTHCPCNLVTLCRTCHDWAHANPGDATVSGWIVSVWKMPHGVPVETAQYGLAWTVCTGELSLIGATDV